MEASYQAALFDPSDSFLRFYTKSELQNPKYKLMEWGTENLTRSVTLEDIQPNFKRPEAAADKTGRIQEWVENYPDNPDDMDTGVTFIRADKLSQYFRSEEYRSKHLVPKRRFDTLEGSCKPQKRDGNQTDDEVDPEPKLLSAGLEESADEADTIKELQVLAEMEMIRHPVSEYALSESESRPFVENRRRRGNLGHRNGKNPGTVSEEGKKVLGWSKPECYED